MQAPKRDSPDTLPPPRLVTLGGFTLISSPVHSPSTLLGPGKPLALLLYLHSAPNHRASREHLTDLLWADVEPLAARHALRQTLWYIRQRLGPASIRADNGDVTLGATLTCDRDDFVRAVTEGRDEEAVGIYQGHFLPDFAVPGGLEFDHWADAERTRLRLMFMRAAETVVRARLSTGHVREARELAQRVRDGSTQSEAAWRLVLETLVAGHDTVGALAEAERLMTVLRQDGRRPEPATRTLLRTIQREPEQDAAPATGLVAELVGRERQFAAIVEAWDSARSGRVTYVHVSAPAGLGKSRLLLDLQARLTAAGGRCVYARANPGERAVPFALAAELATKLADQAGSKGISPASAAALVGLNPALSSTYSQPADTATGDEATRRRNLALAELVRVLADEAALAILVDDLHWSDLASRQLLDAVLGRLAGERVLVVTAARPVPGSDPSRQAVRVELPPLTLEQVTALLASLGELPADLAGELPRMLLEASDGSPLLALESLQAALDAGLLRLDHGVWGSPAPNALAERLTSGSAVRDRVAQLERHPGWLLLLLATGGLPVSTEALAAAADRTLDAVGADLLDLERRGFVQRVTDGWEPAHDAIGEAAAAGASAEARRVAGAALGKALVRDGDPPQHVAARAAQLLAPTDQSALRELFRRWVRARRQAGDRRRPSTLAAELLGEDGSLRARALVATLPVWIRFGLDSPGRLAAVAVALLALAVTTQVVLTRPRPVPPDAVIVAAGDSPRNPSTWRAELRRDAWDPQTDIRFQKARSSLSVVLREGRPSGPIAPAPDGRSWIVEQLFVDSGGRDLVQVFTDGRPSHRLTSTPGEDGDASWAPDGSAIAFTTARWSPLSRYDVAILDIADETVRRLTSGDAADGSPRWSPDGSRIAFSRKFFDGPLPAVCTVGVDGADLQCHTILADRPPTVLGWTDPQRVVIQWDSAGVTMWDLLQVDSWTRVRLGASAGGWGLLSPDGAWMLMHGSVQGALEQRWRAFPIERPTAVRTVSGDIPPEALLTWAPPPTPVLYLSRLRIDPPAWPIPLRTSYELRVHGSSATGLTAPVYSVRWRSTDTAVATIESSGLVLPHRQGHVRIIASAGGWRADTLQIEIGSLTSSPVLHESWSKGLDANWVPWGTPRPTVDLTADGSGVLLTRGDSSFDSGVYTRFTIPAGRGIGLEARVSGTLSALQWQRHYLGLADLDSTWLAGWDHRTGGLDPPNRTTDFDRCWAAYPAAEGTKGSERIEFGCGHEALTGPAPPGLGNGSWHLIRLQLFPDGRLGVAIDGVPIGITTSSVRLDRPYRAVISGQSLRARMLVGDVTIWTSVRDDIDWRTIPER
jgi:DNA-binding SARP family transcriptional activator